MPTVIKLVSICLLFISILSSCAGSKQIAYLENIRDTTIESVSSNMEPVIQKNDLLSISISSRNQEATQIFNVANNNVIEGTNSSNGNTGYANQVFGYLVDHDGLIKFPILGNVRAAGLTKKIFAENITSLLVRERLLLDPIVNVRYLNYKVTVLGEVGKPVVINVPNEKITLLEALGLAGDITVYGRKNNVLLIREEGGRKTTRRIDVNSPLLLTSPYYYLQSNDVVYVQPNKSKMSSVSATRQWLPIIISGLTLMVVSIDRLIK